MTVVKPGGDTVLHLVTDPARRGAQTVAVELDRELSRHGAPGALYAIQPAGDGRATWATIQPLNRRRTPFPLASGLAAPRLRRLVRRGSPRLVLAHGSEAAMCAALATAGTPVPVIWHRILTLPAGVVDSPVRRLPWVAMTRRVAGVVAHSSATEAELAGLGYRGPVRRIATHRPATGFSDLDRDRDRSWLLDQVGAAGPTVLVGLVGHLVTQKRPERAVEVLAALRRQGLDLHLVVVGDGPCRAEVLRQARVRGVVEHMTALGHREDVPRILSGLDLLLITSDADSISGVVVEALMAGCPVASFALDDFELAVVPGRTGQLVPQGHIDALADAVAGLARDRRTLEAMRRHARQRAAAFTTETAALDYLSFFAECTKQRTS